MRVLNQGNAKTLVRTIPAVDRLIRQRDQLLLEVDALRVENSHLRGQDGTARLAVDQRFERLWRQIEFIKGRLSCYLGDGIALTYLQDETPFFVNSSDFGGPTNFLNGGIYEQDNLDVLQSFVRPGSNFLDVGANLGFFSVMIAQRLSAGGTVIAFEPHPFLCDLMQRSLFLNGLTPRVSVRNHGISDQSAELEFVYPRGHLGGGSISRRGESRPVIHSRVETLDDIVGRDTAIDIVKIDVEGHELHVIRGMLNVIRRSPRLVILLEKLERNAGIEDELRRLLEAQRLDLYAVAGEARLFQLKSGALADWSGYILAARPETLEGRLWRNFFAIYPPHL